jgi:hypothetical protein
MDETHQEESEVKMRQIPMKKKIGERKEAHNKRSKSIASLPSHPIDHL